MNYGFDKEKQGNHASRAAGLASTTNDYSANEASRNNSITIRAVEELIQIGLRLNAENAAGPSNGGPVFEADKVRKTAESFKLVSKACSEKCSTKQNRWLLNNVIDRSFQYASEIAVDERMQHLIIEKTQNDSNFRTGFEELGKEFAVLRNSSKKDKKGCLLGWIFKHQPGAVDEDQWYIRFGKALKKLCKKLLKLSAKGISRIVNGIMECFDVIKSTAEKILAAIKQGLCLLLHAVFDPQGEIKRILEDSLSSDFEKARRVVAVVATAIIRTLVLSFGTTQIAQLGFAAAGAVL